MRVRRVVIAIAAACAATGALAQTPAPQPAPAQPAPVSPAPVTPAPAAAPTPPDPTAQPAPATAPVAPAPHIASGTPIVVEITDLITTKTARKGDTFALKLAEPIKYGDREIVPAGTPGVGQVVDAQPSGFLGAPAKLVLAARYLIVDHKHVPIHALHLGGEGADETVASFVVGFAIGLPGILVRGGQMEVPSGTRALAKLGADLPVPESDVVKSSDPAPQAAAPQPAASTAAAPQGTPQ